MGWESRDWARWSDEERNRYLDTPARSVSRMPVDSRRNVVLGVVASAIISAALWHWNVLPIPSVGGSSASNVIHLRDTTGLDIPASYPTTWAIGGQQVTLAVTVQTGETPRHALTVALAARGYVLAP